ncbi:MAG: anaerobic magnesium-protoporphyrin IX monomethyl ester cyclase [Myxococcota bacterium]
MHRLRSGEPTWYLMPSRAEGIIGWMTVLLVHVPVGFEEAYPLALAALASPLLEAGHRVEGLDLARVGLLALQARLDRGDISVVGLSVWSPALAECIEVARLVQEAPGSPTLVVGGPHPTLLPADVPADVVVQGEGELAFAYAVAEVAAGRTPEPILRFDVADMATLPLPDRTVFGVADYHREHRPTGLRYASDVTSRGCLYSCAYCSAPQIWGRGHRFRPAEQVVAHWSQLAQDHGVHGILVEDDLFTQRKARVHELCEQLIRAQRPVAWELLNGVRPETLDRPLLDVMQQAGLTRMALSLESGSPVHLKALGRSPDLQRARQAVLDAKRSGIGVTGYFVMGLPGETEADRRATFDWACSLPLDMAHFSVASAWPGTKWTADDLTHVPPSERSGYYASWYLHPVRAWRAAKVLGVRVSELPDMMNRLAQWMARPLEERRTRILDEAP